MIAVDFRGEAAIVTGGTRGLGRALGLELARAGATVFLTHRWGSAGDDEVRAAFEREDLRPPAIVESDVSDPQALRALMGEVKQRGVALRAIISNVAFAKVVRDMGDLRKSALDLSLAYSAWPVVELAQAAKDVLGAWPRYLLGISSDGPDVCHQGYELAGASKSVLETLVRYLALRLRPEGVRVNAVRPGLLDTQSSRDTFGSEALDEVQRRIPGLFLDPRGVARACVALCSGMMDAVAGEVLVIDEGWSHVSPLSLLTGHAPGGFPR
jgi:NAD(P)-dependent dehydrogenase (short-subunit alcohol dehydrogenase family)